MLTNSKIIVSVIGGHQCNKKVEQLAIKLGENIAKNGYILVCGGLSGVMEYVAKGAKQAKGLTIGILPSRNKNDANLYIDVAIATGLGLARNTIVVSAADVVIAMPGESGTLSEIAFALNLGKLVIDMGQWNVKGMVKASSVAEAMEIVSEVNFAKYKT